MALEPTADDLGFLTWLRTPDGGCTYVVQRNADEWIGVGRLMFHATLKRGIMHDFDNIEERWCYADEWMAIGALTEWQGRDFEGEPSGWHRHPNTGRRRPNGDASKEYITH